MTTYFKLPTRAQGKSYHTPGFVAIFSRQSSRSRSAPRAEWLIAFQAPLSPARPLRSPPSVTRPRTPSTHVHPASTPALSGAHTREFARRPRKRCVARCVAAGKQTPRLAQSKSIRSTRCVTRRDFGFRRSMARFDAKEIQSARFVRETRVDGVDVVVLCRRTRARWREVLHRGVTSTGFRGSLTSNYSNKCAL